MLWNVRSYAFILAGPLDMIERHPRELEMPPAKIVKRDVHPTP